MDGKIRRRYADVLEVCRTGASVTVECEECNLIVFAEALAGSRCRTS